MEALKLHITVKSDTLKIPELKKFIGKEIEVILLDDSKEKKESNVNSFFGVLPDFPERAPQGKLQTRKNF